MANERKTEEIVRQHFQKFGDEVTVEEQSSDSPQINKGNYILESTQCLCFPFKLPL